MTETVRVPDPVYEQIAKEAESRDVTLGAVVEDWMEKAEKLDRVDSNRY